MALETDSLWRPTSAAVTGPEDVGTAREALRRLLQAQAILRATATQPIKDRGGFHVPWLFYSWNVSLSGEGARLAVLVMLDRLQRFRSTQLATYGFTGMPILSSCILLGGGRYSGICIREERKAYGSCRRIEGSLDRSRPVVIIDDS